MNEDVAWVLKIIGFLVAGLFISSQANIINIDQSQEEATVQTSKSATVYQPKTYQQTIILR